MYQENYIGVKISEGLGIFDDNCRYPVIEKMEENILDYATRDVLASTDVETEQNCVEGGILFDHGLPAVGVAIRRYRADKKVSNSCPT